MSDLSKRVILGRQALPLKMEFKLRNKELAAMFQVSVSYIEKCVKAAKNYKEPIKPEPLETDFLIDKPEPIEMNYVVFGRESEILMNVDIYCQPKTTNRKAKEYMMNKF